MSRRPSSTGWTKPSSSCSTELKADLDAYHATTPAAVKVRTLDQAITFDEANKATEMPFFGQETFIAAAKTGGLADLEYLGSRAKSLRLADREGINAMLAKAEATLLVELTYGMPWLSDTVYDDVFSGPSASELPAISGYPYPTVPMGLVRGVPVGLSFIATRWDDQAVLNAGYVFEQAAKARVAPTYAATNDAGPGRRQIALTPAIRAGSGSRSATSAPRPGTKSATRSAGPWRG